MLHPLNKNYDEAIHLNKHYDETINQRSLRDKLREALQKRMECERIWRDNCERKCRKKKRG